MLSMSVLRVNIVLVFLFLWSVNQRNGKNANSGELLEMGYRGITTCESYFIAVGTGGRVDMISISGEVTNLTSGSNENLNDVICMDGKIIVVGDEGTILISEDKKHFIEVDSGTEENINNLTILNDFVIAAVDNGFVLVSDVEVNEWKEIPLPVNGDIISVSSDKTRCYGVTNEGEIVSSTDTKTWNVFNYNLQYEGFNKPCSFNSIYVSGNWITIVGQHEDNTPVSLFSPQGKVWTERSLNYMDEFGFPHIFTNIPNDIGYDPVEEQFFLVCNNGNVSVLSSCTKCNTAHSISDTNLSAVAYLNDFLMIVGEGFGIYPVKLR